MQEVGETPGNIQRPLITLHAIRIRCFPIATRLRHLLQRAGGQARKSSRYRYYLVQGGNHVDPQYDDHAGIDSYRDTVLRPMLPCVRAAIDALATWVEIGQAPPPSHTSARPQGASPSALANSCSLQ